MLVVKRYQRPLSCISISGERVRLTPGVLAHFSKPLADRKINIYAVSHGEYGFSFFIDESETEKAMLALTDIVSASAFEGLSIRKGIGMITVSGPELATTPGLLHKILTPLAKEKINLLAITTTFDSDILLFDFKDTPKAFEVLDKYIPEKIFKIRAK